MTNGIARKHKPEKIIGKLREAEIVLAQGGAMADACRWIGITEQTHYRWRKEYDGMKMDQARRIAHSKSRRIKFLFTRRFVIGHFLRDENRSFRCASHAVPVMIGFQPAEGPVEKLHSSFSYVFHTLGRDHT